MDKYRFRQLIEGYLNDNLSEEDFTLLQRWYDSFGESETHVPGLEDEQAAQALRRELDLRIRRAISRPKIGTEVSTPWRWRRIAAAAAVLVLLGGTGWYTTRQDPTIKANVSLHQQVLAEVTTGVRQVKRLDLPDGSIIHVNANSTLRVPERFAGNQREVFLDEGEAHFEIAGDTLRPFIVRVPNLTVEVVGTAFNVKAYAVLEDITVAVSHGKVRVRDTAVVLGEVAASQRLAYNKQSGQMGTTQLSAIGINSWIRGAVQLERAGFSELALALHNLYGIRLKSDNPHTVDRHYNLSLRSDRSLEETMDVICGIHKTTYRRKGDEVTLY